LIRIQTHHVDEEKRNYKRKNGSSCTRSNYLVLDSGRYKVTRHSQL